MSNPTAAAISAADAWISIGPLRCDICGRLINDLADGYVLWQIDNDPWRHHTFQIVHQGICDDQQAPLSLALEDFLGTEGLVKLTSLLSPGPMIQASREDDGDSAPVRDIHEYVDFFRRMQLPGYESARAGFAHPSVYEQFHDANEVFPYLPEQLERITALASDEA